MGHQLLVETAEQVRLQLLQAFLFFMLAVAVAGQQIMVEPLASEV
jgi:hypothetical protein